MSSKQSIDQDMARQRLSALLDERLEELTRSLRQIVTETAPAPDLVITSYSIHYTKLYENRRSTTRGDC